MAAKETRRGRLNGAPRRALCSPASPASIFPGTSGGRRRKEELHLCFSRDGWRVGAGCMDTILISGERNASSFWRTRTLVE
jgi:hypothetical protein